MSWIIWLTVIVLAIVVIAIIKLVHVKHKVYAVLIVLLLVFLYLTGSHLIGQKGVDLSSGEGVVEAGKVYFTWIGHVFSNAKSLIGQAIKMDWEGEAGNRSLG